jgi:hypothetical protein
MLTALYPSASEEAPAKSFRCPECHGTFQSAPKRNRHEHWCRLGIPEYRVSKVHWGYAPLMELAIRGLDMSKVQMIGGVAFEALADSWCTQSAVSRRANHLAHVKTLLEKSLEKTHKIVAERRNEAGRTRSFIHIIPK